MTSNIYITHVLILKSHLILLHFWNHLNDENQSHCDATLIPSRQCYSIGIWIHQRGGHHVLEIVSVGDALPNINGDLDGVESKIFKDIRHALSVWTKPCALPPQHTHTLAAIHVSGSVQSCSFSQSLVDCVSWTRLDSLKMLLSVSTKHSGDGFGTHALLN